MSIVPDFDWARSHKQPFRHAWIPRLFPSTSNDRIVEWLEQDIPWKFTKKKFYRQFEFSLKDVPPPADLDFLLADKTLAAMVEWLREEFDSPEIEPTGVVAHLLESGHGIGVHNDYRKDGETLRLVLQFSRNVTGGVTALFRDQSPDSLCRLFQPVHGAGIAFAISEVSYHAVSKVRDGQRFTLVYSFRPCR